MLEAVKLEITGADTWCKSAPPMKCRRRRQTARGKRALAAADREALLAAESPRADAEAKQSRRSPSCGRTRRSGATTPAPAGRARNTSTATGSSPEQATRHHGRKSPSARPGGAVTPVAGVELGIAMAGIRKADRKDLLVMRLAPGARRGRVHPEPLLRGTGDGVREAPDAPTPRVAHWSSTPATPMPAPARTGWRRARAVCSALAADWIASRRRCCHSPPA